MPQVNGRIDHMAIDLMGRRLFVAALGNDTVEVVDLKAGKRVHMIAGLAQPQAVLYLADSNELYISNGRTGECRILDGTTDDVFYDAARKRIYVACGAGFLDVIEQEDASTYVPSERIPTAAGARTCLFVPESAVLYLAVPIRKDRDAAIYVCEASPSQRSQP